MKIISVVSVIILIFLNWVKPVQAVFSEIPEILPRAIWENDESLKKLLTWYPEESSFAEATEDKENTPPDYFNIERIVIHDMGCEVGKPGCNNKDRDPIELIQAIYRYHTVTKGWGDIGYHYIIDYSGNIYEGRYGGNGVRGAHAYYDRKCDNFNVGTVGILLMGNYENAQLPEIMYKSLARLVAWLSYTNSLDPSDLSHYSEVWHAPKINKECDISKGSLSSYYTGPVVVGHKEIEEGNSDPGTVDLTKVRQEAQQIILTYKNYLFTSKDTSKVFTIKDGQLREFNSDKTNYTVVNLTPNQLNAFLNTAVHKLIDGALVKSYTRDRVYLIENNKRRPILSQKLFNLRKFKWSNVISLSDRDLAIYPLSNAVAYPEGFLIKGTAPDVYLIENEKRRPITSQLVFNNRGFKWKNVMTVSDEELLSHLPGEAVILKDGTLIKGSGPEIYFIKNQKKHWIKSVDLFLKLGFKWKNVIKLSANEMNQYALGSVIGSVDDFKNLGKEATSPSAAEPRPDLSGREPLIRVGIYSPESNSIFRIKANGPYDIYKNGEFLALKNKDEIFEIKIDSQNNFKFIPKTDDIIFELIAYEDHPQWNPNLNDNLFRGNIEIKYSNVSKKIWVINELGLENYLKGVAEALDNHPAEYLKSLVIAARSYAIFHIENGGKYAGEIFHLKNWANDQLYKGYEFEKRAPNILKAVEETRGVIAIYNNKTIRGLYSSDSGGITKDACKVWAGVFCNEEYNYLKGGIRDPQGTEHIKSAILASHGVGISAAGARQLANQGKNYQDILKYYYPGTEVRKMY
ncbi:MAG: SpoIID/LytB domain-containing protein [Patescibacteria group bacterium]